MPQNDQTVVSPRSAPTPAAADVPLPRIPFNRPTAAPSTAEYLLDAATGVHPGGDGPYGKRAEALIGEAVGGARAVLTTSCTDALELSAMLLDLVPGDEVIVPSFTFVSTALAFVTRGAIPRFADIRPDTLNIDEGAVEALITPRTRAIVPVHYAGVAVEMDEISRLARQHGLAVVEDAAHGLFGAYHGRPLGSLGDMATFSFHETKNLTCGEGGALVLNDPTLVERAEILREKGTNRSRFFRGQVDKYTWVDTGSSYVQSDILAAMLVAQLEHALSIQAHRAAVWNRYDGALRGWAEGHGVVLPTVPAHCGQAYHMYQLLLPSLEVRTACIQWLAERGIQAVFHYLPLHRSPMGERFGGSSTPCPVTDDVSDRLLRLPFHTSLAAHEQDRVVAALQEFPWPA
jgi:dTDP-4-amino-4,6-dideoxygalactose transaminase